MNIHPRRLGTSIAAALLVSSQLAGAAVAGQPRVEAAWFDGELVQFVQPAVYSAKPNGGTFACFGLGPDLTRSSRSAPTPVLYIILNDAATQDHCDGDPNALRHDHVLSTAPGSPGYTASWALVLAVHGPNFSSADMPYTSAAQVHAAVGAGKLVLVPTGATMIAPVIGPAPRA